MQGLNEINPSDILKAVPNGGVIVGGIAAIAVSAVIIRAVYKEFTDRCAPWKAKGRGA